MNNIQKPHKAIYFGLLIILIVLIAMVLLIPFPKSDKTNISPSIKPFPTISNQLQPFDSTQGKPIPTITKPVLVTPTGTGGMEDIPKNVSDSATQKQDLKKILPFNQTGFTITFDYETDKFTVTLNDPKTDSYKQFQSWLKNNYPLISVSKFIIK